MRNPIVNVANVRWRTIAGVDFQQVAPYVMVAKPDRMRAVWVWLRKDQDSGRWEAYVGPAGAPAKAPIASDASASGALAIVMALPMWAEPTNFKPSRPVTVPAWSYPETGRSRRRRPGDYPDRNVAHDSRWDLPVGRRRWS